MIKVLVIDDEPQIRTLLSRIISLEGYQVVQADSCKAARRQLVANQPNIALCDVRLPDGSGIDLISEIRRSNPDCIIIMLTAHGNISDGVLSIKNGAYDYITKGDDNNRIIPLLAQASESVNATRLARAEESSALLIREYSFESILGQSKAITSAINMARKVAVTDASILLTGETGTGKEVFANAIHNFSLRAKNSFVAINCSALGKELLESELFGHVAGAFTGAIKEKQGLIEKADKGTIFLDEIGEMPLDLQAKLLRVLENGEYMKVGDTAQRHTDVRIIAATNRNLKQAIEQGIFRADLFYRLSVFAIELPSLRARSEDVAIYAQHFIDIFSTKFERKIDSVDDSFMQALKAYSWHGNVRELRNVIERSVILCSDARLRLSDLPYELQMGENSQMGEMELANIERQHISKILSYTNGNKTETARLLKIGLTTLYRKIEEYKIAGYN